MRHHRLGADFAAPVDYELFSGTSISTRHQVRYLTTLLSLTLLFVSGTSAALNETYYVDNTSSGPSLGTQADPFHSIKEAADILEQGDTAIVAGGSEAAPTLYAERISFGGNPNSGIENARITIRAEPRRSVVMYGFETDSTDYLTIEGFQITIPDAIIQADPSAKYALLINSDDVQIRDNYFFDVPGWAIRVDHNTPWHVRGVIADNHLFRCGVGISIYGDDWLVEGNDVESLVRDPGLNVDSDYSRAFGSNITFRGNHFHGTQAADIGSSHVDGFQAFDNNGWYLHNFTFEENIITDFHEGIILESGYGSGNISDVMIRNNIFDGGNLTGAYGVYAKWGVTNLLIAHNIFANMDIHAIFLRFGAEGTVANNIFYDAGANYHADASSPLMGLNNILNREGHPYYSDPSDIVNVDPLFSNANNWLGADGLPFTADDGYKLLSTSPAIDAGANVGIDNDILGSLRPQNGLYDIGPHEFLSSSPPNSPPAITILGPNPVTIDAGTAYVDAGATASDPEDGNITANIVTVNNVDTSSPGTYTVTYDVADSDGNSAPQSFRTVNVVSNLPPAITIVGPNPVSIEGGASYVDAGATAADPEDGNITASIVTVDNVDTSSVGTYTVTYDVTDSDANQAPQAVRTVNVVPPSAPAITVLGANPVTIDVGTPYVDAGATAMDAEDGDITANIVTVNSVDADTIGTYTVTYDVTDSSNIPAPQAVRVVDVVGIHHSADTDGDFSISLSELLRVVQFFDVGEFHCDATTEDGYAPGAGSQVCFPHDSDYDVQDFSISMIELLRLIQIFNVGAYHVDGSTEDGYAPGASRLAQDAQPSAPDSGPPSAAAATRAATVLTLLRTLGGPGAYEPGSTLDITVTISSAGDDTVTALGLEETLPAGWSFDSVVSGDVPSVTPAQGTTGTLGFAYISVPAFPVSFTYRVNVPVNATGPKDVLGEALYRTTGPELSSGIVTTTIEEADVTAPIITIQGANPVTIEVGSGYADAGATALDNVDGNLTGSIVTVNSANPNAVGVYSVTYDVTDSSGNSATQALRVVNVVDTTSPGITIFGANPATIEVGSGYVDAGATAYDVGDGNLTGAIVTVNSVNANAVGVYNVTYNVTDSSGNPATQAVRVVNVVDTTAPVITIVGADPTTIEVGSGYVDAGATAFDVGDGNLTGSIVTVNSVNANAVGVYNVSYDVTDSSGNPAAQAVRVVNVVDTTVPVIAITGSNPVTVELGAGYVDAGATALDNVDGDLTGSIVAVNNVDDNAVGVYSVTYDVTDSSGNPAAQAVRVVNVTRLYHSADTDEDYSNSLSELLRVIQLFDVGRFHCDSTSEDGYAPGAGPQACFPHDSDFDVQDFSLNMTELLRLIQFYNVGSYHVDNSTEDGYAPGASRVAGAVGDLASGSSSASTVTRAATVLTLSRTLGGVGAYEPGSTFNITVTISSAGDDTVTALGLAETLPAGWSFDSVVSGDVPAIAPVQGAADTLGFAYISVPAFPVSFTYRVNVPLGETGPKDVVGEVLYRTTAAELSSGTVTTTINDVDSAAPVITILGANPVTIEVGSGYVDAGATAFDNVDGDLTAAIVTVNNVNANAVGVYSVTYDVTDSSGNPAAQAVRTVTVDPPVNAPPTANAGPDQNVTLALGENRVSVTLDASSSSDADGTIAGYTWTGTPDPADAVGPNVTLEAGVHEFTLVVTDDGGLESASDVVSVTVAAHSPVAFFVDSSNDSGIEDGTEFNPFDTIGEALALVAADRGDSITVMAGSYAESFIVPSATQIRSQDGAFNTAILGSEPPEQGLSATVTLHPASALSGFSITGGTMAAVDVPTPGLVTITNCVLFESDTGLHLASGSLAEVVNCTLVGNASFGAYAMPGAAIADLRNTVIADNATGIASDSGGITDGGYNLFWNNGVDLAGPAGFATDLAGDPAFVSALDANFHLGAYSAARDAGDPDLFFDDLDGTQNDIGADGGPGGVEDTAAPLAVAIVDPSSGVVPLTVTFDASASSDEWGVESYLWDVDSVDGIQTDLEGPGPQFTYEAPGSFIATLTVFDNSGFSSTTTVQIEVGDNLPVASFSADPSSGQLPLQVNFTGLGSDPIGGDVTFEYDFGDGTTSNVQNPSHTYTEDLEPGAYTVELRVTNDRGATTAVQRSITLSENQVEIQTEITPEDGGTLEITDPDSELNGLAITVPADAVSDDTILTAGPVPDPPSPPSNSFGIAVDIGPSGTVFSTPITIMIPLPDGFDENPPFIVLFYDEATGTWTSDGITNVQFIEGAPTDFLQFDVTHLTTFMGAQARAVGGDDGGIVDACFIATAAYGTPLAAEIGVLRQFRDRCLLDTAFGSAFVDTYYRLSPPIAEAVAQNAVLRSGVRMVLVPVVLVTELLLRLSFTYALLLALTFGASIGLLRCRRLRG